MTCAYRTHGFSTRAKMACCSLQSVDIPPTLRYVAHKAFFDCSQLTHLALMPGKKTTWRGTCAESTSFDLCVCFTVPSWLHLLPREDRGVDGAEVLKSRRNMNPTFLTIRGTVVIARRYDLSAAGDLCSGPLQSKRPQIAQRKRASKRLGEDLSPCPTKGKGVRMTCQ